MAGQSKIRCRQIGPADLDGIADLLSRGFPLRPRQYWARGLSRLAQRTVPEGLPRFGFMLDNGGAPVGAILTIVQTVSHAGEPFVRCNLASWYVEPAFRSHAAMLGHVPLRFAGVTYLNVSPAPNTWPMIEAERFSRYTFGQRVTLPALGRGAAGLTVRTYRADDAARLPEAALLADHAANGCLALVGEGPEGLVPFVMLQARVRQGRFWLPGVQLVYCRDMTDVARFAVPLGRLLLRRGTPLLIFDAVAETPGPRGVWIRDRARKYVRGSHPPRLGDLAYTEFTIFGS